MPTSEEDNLYRLLRSEQIEYIVLGLQLAQSLQISIKGFVSDIKQLYEWNFPKEETALEVKIARLNQCSSLGLNTKN